MTSQGKTITVAAAQLPARPLEQASRALQDIADAVAAASRGGAELVVLPECSYPAYWLGSKERYFGAGVLTTAEMERWLGELALQQHVAIVAGVVHEQDGVLRDTAVLLDAAGRVKGRHDKTFLWDAEHNWYEPGRRVQPIETEFGSIGMLVCAEGRSPEVLASHAAQEAGLLAMPTAWVNAAARPGEYYNPQPDFLIQARAYEFGLPIVCANKFGQECEEARFCGMSLIVSGGGEILARAPADQPALLVARVQVRPKRLLLPEATVKRLLETAPPVRPPVDARPLRAAVLGPRLAGQSQEQVDALLAGRGVQAVLRLAHEEERTIIDSNKRGLSPLRMIGQARVGYLTAGQARSFVRGRLLAMEGAQVLCVVGPLVDLPTLRVRAVENQVFVVAAPQEQVTVIAPSGEVIARGTPTDEQPLIVDLELAWAAGKLVAPQTDIWQERRCGAYCFARRRS